MALTEKQKRFVAEYLLDGNGARAAVAAGYSEKTARQIAAENLSKPDVAEAIAVGRAELAKKSEEKREITRDWLIEQAEGILRDAWENGKFAAATGALKELGILTGHRVEKQETTTIPHEDRLMNVRERISGDRPTAH